MKIVKGVVKYGAGAPREGQYGPSINILVTLEDGSQVRVYGKPGDVIERYKSGQNIQLIDDKGKYKVVEEEMQQAAKQVQNIDVSEKPDLAKLVFDMSALYSKSYVEIYNAIVDAGIPHENATAATSTIFIQVFQKLR
jgi:ATP sulfurylase